jgi:hypothetical protein
MNSRTDFKAIILAVAMREVFELGWDVKKMCRLNQLLVDKSHQKFSDMESQAFETAGQLVHENDAAGKHAVILCLVAEFACAGAAVARDCIQYDLRASAASN